MEERKYLDSAQQPSAAGDMEPESFRMYGHQVVDWIADYLTHVGEYPVLAQTAPGDIRHALPDKPPLQPESMEAILADFERVIMPGITHWNSPGFLAYFGITGSAPGILGEMLSGARRYPAARERAGRHLARVVREPAARHLLRGSVLDQRPQVADREEHAQGRADLEVGGGGLVTGDDPVTRQLVDVVDLRRQPGQVLGQPF